MGKRAQQKAATRRLLKQVALELFTEQGVAGVRPADVTQAAGVAQGTFYVHFSNHAELVDELVADLNAELNGAMFAALSEARPTRVRDALAVLAGALVDHYEPRMGVFGVFTDFLTRHGPSSLMGANRAIVQAVMAAVRGYRDETVTDIQAEVLGHCIVASWRQFVLRGIRPDEDRQEVIGALLSATEAMSNAFLPNVFDMDTSVLVVALASAVQSPASEDEDGADSG